MKIFYTDKDQNLKEELFKRIKADLSKVPAEYDRVILVVPAQSTLSSEEEAFRQLGGKGFLTFNVVSGQKLMQDILKEAGGSGRTPISTIGRGMILRRAVKKCGPMLSAFSGICSDPGFIDTAGDFIVQMKQNGLSAADLDAAADGARSGSLLKRKLKDMQILASYYQEAMEGKFTDSDDNLRFVTAKVSECESLKRSRIYYSGFYSFTENETEFLKAVDKNSSGLEIAMLCEDLRAKSGRLSKDITDMEFEAAARSIARLTAAFDGSANAEKVEGNCEDAHPSLEVCRCASTFTQAETIASEIMRSIKDEGLSYSDFAVLVPDDPMHAGSVKRVLESVGIPVFMDETRPVVHSSGAVAVSALASLACGEYRPEDIVSFLKSGIFCAPGETVWVFENYVKQCRIKGKKFLAEFKYKTKEISEASLKNCEELRKSVMGLIEPFACDMQEAKTIGQKAEILKSFLKDSLRYEDKLEDRALAQGESGYAEAAEETRQVMNAVNDILSQMTELMGEEDVDCEEFEEIFLGALSAVKVGVLPQSEGKVLIGSIKRSLPMSRKYIFAASMCDGLIPSAASDGGILTDREQAALSAQGINIAKSSDVKLSEEIFSIFRSLSCALEKLWIGVPSTDPEGESLMPSPLVAALLSHPERFQSIAQTRDIENRNDSSAFMIGDSLATGKVSEALRGGLNGEDVSPEWLAAFDVLSEKAPYIAAALLYEGDKMKTERSTAERLFSREDGAVSISPSELDLFASCPFKHFVNYGLKAQEPRPFEVSASEIGNIYHDAIMKLCQKFNSMAEALGEEITGPNSPWMTAGKNDVKAILKEILDEIIFGKDVTDSTPEDEYKTERIREVCLRFAWHLIEHVRAGKIKKMFLEADFHRPDETRPNPAFPPIVVNTSAGKVYIEGRIDRVDELPSPNGDTFIKIVDYKSGDDKFEKKLVEKGLKVQLFTYLEGAIAEKADRKPAGVYYFRINADRITTELDSLSNEDLAESIKEKITEAYLMDGITVDDYHVLDAVDSRINQSGRKESNVVNVGNNDTKRNTKRHFVLPEEMDMLRSSFRAAISDAAERLCNGDIKADPKEEGTLNACRYCAFNGICLKELAN